MRRIWLLLLLIFIVMSKTLVVQAQEKGVDPDEVQKSYLEELNLDEISDTIKGMLGDEKFDFKDAVGRLLKGEMPLTAENVQNIIINTFSNEISRYRGSVIVILMIVVASSIFTNFTGVFEKSQIADVSFYMMYILLFTVLMKAFFDMSQLTLDTLSNVLGFMKVLLPAYFAAATFASGSFTAAGFYELTLILIMVIQGVMKYFIVPAINLYVLFSLLNHLAKEEYLSKMADLLRTVISWVLKTLLTVVIGVQTVQCLIMPAVDSLKNTVLHKTSGAIPVIGNIFNAVSEVVIGSAVLLKNAVGVAGLIIILLICLSPIIRMALFTLLYKILAAVVQPISEKRMLECISNAGEGGGMLLKVIFTASALFLITLAMVTASIRGL